MIPSKQQLQQQRQQREVALLRRRAERAEQQRDAARTTAALTMAAVRAGVLRRHVPDVVSLARESGVTARDATTHFRAAVVERPWLRGTPATAAPAGARPAPGGLGNPTPATRAEDIEQRRKYREKLAALGLNDPSTPLPGAGSSGLFG